MKRTLQAQRVYVLSARPGTIQRAISINLPGDRTHKIKRQPQFFAYSDEILGLLRGSTEEAV